jgi:hypothetical protein
MIITDAIYLVVYHCYKTDCTALIITVSETVVVAVYSSLFSENLIQCSKEDSLIMHACWFLLLVYDKKMVDGKMIVKRKKK